MNRTQVLRTIILLCSASLISACATPRPSGEWRNTEFSGTVDNILVIGVSSRSTRRRVYEDKFVEALSTMGTNGVPSYELLTTSLELSRPVVERAIRGQNLGAVLITRLVGVKQEEVFQLPADYDYHKSYFGYYDNALQETNKGTSARHSVYSLETNLYDTASGKLIWTMQSEAMDASRPRHVIEEQVILTIQSLARQGLIETE